MNAPEYKILAGAAVTLSLLPFMSAIQRPQPEVRPPEPIVMAEPLPALTAPVIAPAVKKTNPIGCQHYRHIFARYDWNVDVAMAICQAESGGRPDVVSKPNTNGTRDYGLMQLNQIPVLDPAENIRIAYVQKYKTKQGWNHWTVYKTGAYLKYL